MMKFCFFVLSSFLFISCTLGTYQPGTLYQIQSRSLSFNEPDLRTCVFDPHYSVVHFPMYHEPPTTQFSHRDYELVVRSQFQLLHTIVDYQRSLRGNLSVFDEHITSDSYNADYIQALENGLAESDTLTKLNGAVFRYSERFRTAKNLFGQGFPSHYEYLNELQKKYLFNTGASLTLYFLKEISKIYKVISPENMSVVKANLVGSSSDFLERNENEYWIYTFRDMELRREVDRFYQKNPFYRGLVFIAYGADHDFLDDFAGLPFQSGKDFCLIWDHSSSVLP